MRGGYGGCCGLGESGHGAGAGHEHAVGGLAGGIEVKSSRSWVRLFSYEAVAVGGMRWMGRGYAAGVAELARGRERARLRGQVARAKQSGRCDYAGGTYSYTAVA